MKGNPIEIGCLLILLGVFLLMMPLAAIGVGEHLKMMLPQRDQVAALPTQMQVEVLFSTMTPQPTATASPTDSHTPTPTPTWTTTATETPSPTATSTDIPTSTPAPTFTEMPTATLTWTPIPTATATPTWTPSPTVATPTPSPTIDLPSAEKSSCDCSGNLYNCDDFPFSWDAQACFLRCIALGAGDIHDLDRDDDGDACEWSW